MRRSDYMLEVDLEDDQRSVLVHGYSGAIDIVSHRYREALENPLKIKDKKIIEFLLNRGYLTTYDKEDEKRYINSLAQSIHRSYCKSYAAFAFAPTFGCNMRCTYCFQANVQSHHTKTKLNKIMSLEQVDQAYKAMEEILDKKNMPFDSIGLWGGEPLQKSTYPVVERIINKCNRWGLDFFAVSNGLDLDTFKPLIRKGGISKIQVTIDGPQWLHDKRRIKSGGKGTFQSIINNISNILNVNPEVIITVRINVNSENIEHLESLFNYLKDIGILDFNNFKIYVEEMYEKNTDGSITFGPRVKEFLHRFQDLSKDYPNFIIGALSNGIEQQLKPTFDQGKSPLLTAAFCAAHYGMFIFAPDGKVYTCWESIGESWSVIGQYMPHFSLEKGQLQRWEDRNVTKLSQCMDCPLCLFCAGGCAQFAHYQNKGDMFHSYCSNYEALFRNVVKHLAWSRPQKELDIVSNMTLNQQVNIA